MDPLVAIISSGRVAATQAMNRHIGGAEMDVAWYVGEGEGDDYREFTDDPVVESGSLIESRNAALDDAFANDRPCLQLSDDLTGIKILTEEGARDASLFQVIGEMEEALRLTGARLAGVAPTNNPFFGKLAVNERGFCVGDMILVAPTELRFDPALRLKEDYDYTAQHLLTYGKVARCDWILPAFRHGTNRGGAVAYRTPDLEKQSIDYLKSKWPGSFRDNPKRPDEVLFRWSEQGALG